MKTTNRDLPNRLNGVKEVAFARCRDIRGVSTLREFIPVRFNELMFDHDVANAVDGEVSHLRIKGAANGR